MPIVTVTQPADGQTADANDVNSQIDAILAVLNGGIDSANIANGGVTNANLAGGITVDKLASSSIAGWASLGQVPNTVTYGGNRSYSLVFNSIDLTSILSPAMRLKLTRTVAAPTQSTSLNGSSQFYSKTSPAGMTFTDTFSASGWVKLTSYASSNMVIESRYNGTSGWIFQVAANTGQIQLAGFNGGSANFRAVISSQGIPLNKWVHVAATFQMSDHTSSTCAVYIDGMLVPSTITTGGTNPTAIIQAGNFEIGSTNGGTLPFPGKLAQIAIYSAVLTQATLIASANQTLAGTETNLVSAYSFNNSINDLNANANNLTANGSAVATNADSPFAQAATAGTLEYGIVTAIVFSTNTTLTVSVPEGSAIPTTGGVGAVSYTPVAAPYLFPALSKFKIWAWDTSGTLTNPLITALVNYVINNPIDNIPYVNVGTAGGSFTLSVEGAVRKVWGGSASQTSHNSPSYTVTIPTNFLTTIQTVQTQAASMVTDVGQVAPISAFTATTITIYFDSIANSVSATMLATFLVIGS